MAYDEGLAERLRDVLGEQPNLTEKKMFGGLAFMLSGNMFCGIIGDELMVRVGPENYENALSQPHARPMDFTGKPMKGYVYVEPDGFESEENLAAWANLGADFVLTLPPK